MNREETLEYIYYLGFVPAYVSKLANSSDIAILDDIVQEIWLQLCEVPERKWTQLWEQGTKSDNAKAVRGYISGVIYRNVKSTNSRVYYKLKRFRTREFPQEVTDEKKNL